MVEAFSLMHKVLTLCCSRFNIKSCYKSVWNCFHGDETTCYLTFFVLAVWCSNDIMICKNRIACYSHRMGWKSSMLKGKLWCNKPGKHA